MHFKKREQFQWSHLKIDPSFTSSYLILMMIELPWCVVHSSIFWRKKLTFSAVQAVVWYRFASGHWSYHQECPQDLHKPRPLQLLQLFARNRSVLHWDSYFFWQSIAKKIGNILSDSHPSSSFYQESDYWIFDQIKGCKLLKLLIFTL